jgi:hypothetical protein
MDYQKVYSQLIAKAQARSKVEDYVERHHVVPKSLGGTDDKSNLVSLTAREHFLAHMLLARIHGGSQWLAVIRMRGMEKRYVNNRLYAIAKKQQALAMSRKHKGKTLSLEHKANIAAASKGRAHSAETRAKLSNALIGHAVSAETRAKIGATSKGRTHTATTRAKIGAANKRRIYKPMSVETKAKLSAAKKGRSIKALHQSVIREFAFGVK